MPVAATMPNITRPAPPSTYCGTEAMISAILGKRPKAIRIAPPATHTQRLLTPVTPTRPTFCEKLVCGKVFRKPPIRVPRPSVRRPRVRSSRDSRRPVSSPSARNMPSDSTITTTITRHMVAIEIGSKTGMPKCSGVTTDIQCTSARPSKLTLPSAIAIAKPTPMPSSTATLDRKPRP